MPALISTPKRWFTLAQASVYAGLSPDTLRRLIRRRQLTAHDPTGSGRPVILDKNELDKLIESSGGPAPAA